MSLTIESVIILRIESVKTIELYASKINVSSKYYGFTSFYRDF